MPPRAVGILGTEPATALDLAARVRRLMPGGREPDGVRLIAGGRPAPGGPVTAAPLMAEARRLEAAGADVLALAGDAAHAFLFDIERAVGIPVISQVEEAGAEAARRAPPGGAVGLRLDEAALQSGLYQAQLARHGLTALPSDQAGAPVIDPTASLAAAIADLVLGRRPPPPPFTSTEVGPA